MAGLILGVGAAVGGAALGTAIGIGATAGQIIGGAIGTSVGSYIDNALIFPPKGPKTPSKIDDIPFQTASEGSPINRCLGPETRVAGTIIWMSKVRSDAIRKRQGKAGGGKKSTVGWKYYADFAVVVCEGEISDIKKILSDGKIIYADEAATVKAASTLSCTAQTLFYYDNFGGDYLAPAERRKTMYIESPNGGPDLSEFRSGRDVNSAGWNNGANNGDFRCLESGNVLGGGGETYVVLLNADVITEGAGFAVTLTQAAEEYDASVVDEVTIYVGDQAQTADDVMEAALGAGNVPGYRGLAYVVLENVALADSGNRPPQFNFIVQEAASRTVEDAAGIMIEESRLTGADYDTSALSGLSLTGQITPGPEAPANRLQPLMIAYDLIMQNVDGVLTFIERQNAIEITVNADDLAAHEDGSDAARPLTITDPDDATLPSEINIAFNEPNLEYLRGSQRVRKLAGVTPQDSVLQMSLPLSLGPSTARAIAKRILWMAWLNRQRVSLQLPPSYTHVLENDRLIVSYNPTITVLVQRVERGHNHLIRIEGVIESSNVLDQSATADDPDFFAAEIYVPPALFLTVIDIAPLTETEIELPGFYYGACSEERRVVFPGGALYARPKVTTYVNSFSLIEAFEIDAALGITTETLPDGVTGVWDTDNVIKVRMFEGAPASADELAILDGENRAVIGNEVIAFRDVSQIDAENYELSYLLRGLRNTEAEAGVHEARERFILLNEGGLQFEKRPLSVRGNKGELTAVPLGSEPTEQDSLEVELGMYSLRCFSPCHVKGVWTGEDEDLTIYWIRRTRGFVGHFNQPPDDTPLYESPEKYRVEILDAPGGSVVRTFTIKEEDDVYYDAPEGRYTAAVIYTEAMQIADFGSVQSDYDVKVHQWSYRIGWGKPKEENVPL